MSDNRAKRDGFGIDEAGHTPASTPLDDAEAARLQPAPRATARCARCHQLVPPSWLIWTNTHGEVCADCYDRMGPND